ncbi:hypothetical protein H112_01804 [Trichophyton rubrum D6]|uniref:Uncharacterized protein n=3 Tax=Trichophyton TaxID=5550 RepID=F2SVK2_TRIRC|nr:uncharacterized protein TERG_06574 [Trichophyton rubrum CBS 118892]EZF25998.1 hypothetical protein H100_01800 [Trichophyton rubrum MR850]EZF45074.1 hypothetical protein H102_01794 [Trichophyton rubrum CBS 100081]EZF55646.1 hypothetical protein H103_01804 [Trichophyton rubrum CBS 288.86]EZF66311.1 hypothetical protein H104_01782 [Trichophyton rubrum CBS 289.86]EZF76992.1 hypothetical protein H105_01809 [Trichophyton soudanense CBS 452.61]EZF87628.1 hypothetical protein H110_01805 [Trichophy
MIKIIPSPTKPFCQLTLASRLGGGLFYLICMTKTFSTPLEMSMIPEGTHGHIAEHAALTSKIIICAIPSAKRRMFHSRALDYTFLMQAYALTCMAVEIERLKELPCPSTLAYNKHQAARNDPLDTPQLQNHSLQRYHLVFKV